MITKIKKVYYCEHCKKHFISKHFAQQHEERCSKNPDNFRACFGCKYLKQKTANVYIGIDEYYSCEPIYENREILFCEKLNHFVYPPKAEHKGTYYTEFDDDKSENKPMPEECEFVDYNIEY